ncbi:MAG: SIS domain-containing protein [Firmicutes bacterium]|jgi:KpsF/GutQ family protein|nr:SIS domain-containing protein [Bacillota bacterium]
MEQGRLYEIAKSVWMDEGQALSSLIKSVDMDVLSRVTKLLLECKGRILLMGLGTSSAAAHKIAHTLACVQIPAFAFSPADGAHGALGAVCKEDVVIAISKGGKTQEILRILPLIKARGAHLIAVTENEGSPLAQGSDVVLQIKVEREACPFNMLATCSTLAVIAVFDAIAIAVMHSRAYSREEFANIHPGGAVGERLKLELSENR